MRKYWLIFKNFLFILFTYRANFLLVVLGSVAGFVIMFFIWKSVYASTEKVGVYNLKNMVTYYLVSVMITNIVLIFNTAIIDDINRGRIISFFVKPLNYVKFTMASELALKLVLFCLKIPLFLIIALYLKQYFIFEGIIPLLQCLFSVILAWFLGIYIYLAFGYLTFWFHDIFPLFLLLSSLTGFFSGQIIPLDILPGFLQKLSYFLPFRYLVFEPINLYFGKVDNFFIIIFSQIIWLAFFIFLERLLWKKGIKTYQAFGN
jgi:ABC-2 type transport system permease protein